MQAAVSQFALDLIRPRKYNYSLEPLEHFTLVYPQTYIEHSKTKNKNHHHLDTILIKANKQNQSKICIIYAHGLGSNQLQALNIAKHLIKQNIDVCSFDFSGSGRSEGSHTTYGLSEQHDINAIYLFLQQKYCYDRYVIWGRSMGAVSTVLSVSCYSYPKVDCLVLDSPFCSFEQVAIQIADRKSFIPKFMISLLIDPLRRYMSENLPVNPFQIDIRQQIKTIDLRIMLIFSNNDSIIHSNHSKQLINFCKRPVELQIDEDHNKQRSKSTLNKIQSFIKQSMTNNIRKASLSKFKNRGISVTSKQSKERDSIRSVSKIKLTQRRDSTAKNDIYMRTIGSFNQSLELFGKRIDTEGSPINRKKIMQISSVYMQNNNKNYLEGNRKYSNKQNIISNNIRPTLNLMRKNRFK